MWFLILAILFALAYFIFKVNRDAKNIRESSAPIIAKANETLRSLDRSTATYAPSPSTTKYSPDGNMIIRDTEIVSVRVAGVTYKNGRRTRQAILRAIKWGDAPYDGDVDITIKKTTFEGSDAFEVWANEEMIGYVPKNQVPFFSKNWNRYYRSIGLEVSGGGQTDDGEQVNYGAQFSAQFRLN